MKPFHIYVHARPMGDLPTEVFWLDGRSIPRWNVPPSTFDGPLSVTFEQVSRDLEPLRRMLLEPDGSFVWVGGSSDADRWQVDGVLWDRGGRLQNVELRGSCPLAEFNQLLDILRGVATNRLAIQLVQQAVLLDEAAFREWQFL